MENRGRWRGEDGLLIVWEGGSIVVGWMLREGFGRVGVGIRMRGGRGLRGVRFWGGRVGRRR